MKGSLPSHRSSLTFLRRRPQVLYIAYTAIGFMNIKYGVGKYLVDVPPAHRPIAMMWRWIGTYFYIVIAALVKITIALFLLRICNHRRWERITLWTMIAIVAAYNLFFVLLAIFACRPVEYQWTGYNPIPAEGECNSSGWATYPSYIAGFLNVLADWMLPLLPARLVWQAKMERRKKLSVCAVLALGSVYVLDFLPLSVTNLNRKSLTYSQARPSHPSSDSPTPSTSSTTPNICTTRSPCVPGRQSKSASDSPPPRSQP